MRRAVASLCLATVLLAAPLAAEGDRFRVTLLGTGSPPPKIDRFGPATLVEAGHSAFLFDVGRGALQRLTQAGVRYGDLRAVFLTHLHSDHVVGLPDLWLSGWVIDQTSRPLELYGPVGTAALARHLEEAFAYDRRIRVEDDHREPAGATLHVTEIQPGVVYDRDGVKITAFLVDHQPIAPAFGYRIDHGGHAVVLSGDTRYSDTVVAMAKGVDLLVHEVAVRTGQTQATSRMLHHHTLPDQAGQVFTRAAPKLAVYTHVDLSADVSEEQLVAMTRTTYRGPLVVGADLMSFDVGDRVVMHPPPAAHSGGS